MKLAELYANIDNELWKAQSRYENAIKQYGIFRNEFVNAKVEYEKMLAGIIQEIKAEDGKVTSAKEIAKGQCSAEYKTMLEFETKYKYYNAPY